MVRVPSMLIKLSFGRNVAAGEERLAILTSELSIRSIFEPQRSVVRSTDHASAAGKHYGADVVRVALNRGHNRACCRVA